MKGADLKRSGYALLLVVSLASMLFSFLAMSFAGYILFQDHIPPYIKDYLIDRPTIRRVLYSLSNSAYYGRTGTELGDGRSAIEAVLNDPIGIYVNSRGEIFVSDHLHHRVRKISEGMISTVAGNSWRGFSGDGQRATLARLSYPEGLMQDPSGTLFVADRENHRLRKISPEGIIRTVAGTGRQGFSGDGGPANQSRLNGPTDVYISSTRALYVADRSNHRVRRIDPDGIITTIAGTGWPGFSGDGGPAVKAALNEPYGVTLDHVGNIFIADSGNHSIRRVSADGTITTVAGTGEAGFSGDGDHATRARLNNPSAIFVTAQNDIFITDEHNHRIRKISPSGIIQTIAGNGIAGYSGDGGPATHASLNDPEDLWIDTAGNIIFTDGDNHLIRKIAPNGIITTIAGGGTVIYP